MPDWSRVTPAYGRAPSFKATGMVWPLRLVVPRPHCLGTLGINNIVHIGTCGPVGDRVRTGDVVLSTGLLRTICGAPAPGLTLIKRVAIRT